ncbi:synaptotagmin-10-like [Ostrea edulis]|uniref:synaptotagmin-10-like n=1 Tax=Ostrea edulis TaxID=37623 RepID=UPI0024AF9E81|nr:synaptotagmin-10-like [Ostrea edulis]
MGQQNSKYNSSRGDPEQGVIPQNTKKIQGMSRILTAKAEHRREVAVQGWDKHDENMRNMQLLKGLFKQLDPTVMKSVVGVRGEIQLSFKYDFKRHLLLVKVIKCRELRSKDLRSKMSDPYIKLTLMPDNDGLGERRTAVMRQCNDPVFDEIFAFPLEEYKLSDLKMVVQVIDADIMGQDDFIGEVIVEMNTFNFRETPFHTAWYSLHMETDLNVSGELEISAEFQLPASLFVTLFRAQGLSARDEGKSADPFVKLTVTGTSSIFQTQVRRDTLDPEWNETFEFDLTQEELSSRYLILHVIDQDRATSNDSLGQVVIDLRTFDPEKRLHETLALADLRNTELLRTKWGQQATTQEFKEALMAHAASKHPSFLFSEHSGKKVVNVSCRKAGARGRIRIIDGIPVK